MEMTDELKRIQLEVNMLWRIIEMHVNTLKSNEIGSAGKMELFMLNKIEHIQARFPLLSPEEHIQLNKLFAEDLIVYGLEFKGEVEDNE